MDAGAVWGDEEGRGHLVFLSSQPLHDSADLGHGPGLRFGRDSSSDNVVQKNKNQLARCSLLSVLSDISKVPLRRSLLSGGCPGCRVLRIVQAATFKAARGGVPLDAITRTTGAAAMG
jgi:hypothetical protein